MDDVSGDVADNGEPLALQVARGGAASGGAWRGGFRQAALCRTSQR
ncbi:MAG: hypothetical protein LBH56_03525 [Coriobacteriales bacterium]|nr:hypothetical protein [Coriobacteriales bacterium]